MTDRASERASRKPFAKRRLVGRDAHPLAAAAGRRLDHHRIADAGGDPRRLVGVGDDSEMSRHSRDAGLGGERLRRDLVAHRLDRRGRWADEDDPGRLERAREGGVLGEEAVARMHGIRPCLSRRLDDPLDRQDSSARPAPVRSPPPRRPSRHAGRCGPPPNRRRRSRSPSAARCGSPGRRSRPGWRRGFF